MLSPDSGQPVSLPEFLRRIQKVGSRCEPDIWNTIFDNAIAGYQAQELLSEDWESLPSGDIYYLVKNGAGKGDDPIPSIKAAVKELESSAMGSKDQMAVQCLSGLADRIQSLPCYIHSNMSMLETIMQEPESQQVLRPAYCGDACAAAVGQGLPDQCTRPSISEHPVAGPFLEEFNAHQARQSKVCVKPSGKSNAKSCAHTFMTLGHLDWVFEGRPSSPAFVDQVQEALDKLRASTVPDEIKPAFGRADGADALTDYGARDTYQSWMQDLEAGICTLCVWQWFAGEGKTATPLRYMQEYEPESTSDASIVPPCSYLSFVFRYYNICTSRGADYLGAVRMAKIQSFGEFRRRARCTDITSARKTLGAVSLEDGTVLMRRRSRSVFCATSRGLCGTCSGRDANLTHREEGDGKSGSEMMKCIVR